VILASLKMSSTRRCGIESTTSSLSIVFLFLEEEPIISTKEFYTTNDDT